MAAWPHEITISLFRMTSYFLSLDQQPSLYTDNAGASLIRKKGKEGSGRRPFSDKAKRINNPKGRSRSGHIKHRLLFCSCCWEIEEEEEKTKWP